MTHMDESTLGRMLEEVIRLIMLDDLEAESEHLAFEYSNCKNAYGAESNMYRQLLDAFAFAIAVEEVVSEQWRPEFDEPWASRSKELEQAFGLG
jgi:hypothetical protein